MRKYALYILLMLSQLLFAQTDSSTVKKWEIGGYFSSINSYLESNQAQTSIDYSLQNRLNIDWYPTNYLTGSLQMRNRFLMGDMIRNDASGLYASSLEDDNLAVNILEQDAYLLNVMVDRLNFKYSVNKLDVTVGRQRINWGQTYVFNANDIFNAYSYVDFDYPERPGADAARVQFYPSYTSTVEAAVKYDNDSTITAGLLGRFNKWGYDWQAIAGYYNSNDWVIGGAWSGNIKSLSFSGELSYLMPKESSVENTNLLLASVNLNYTFSNSLSLQFETFYDQYLREHSLNFVDIMYPSQDIRMLSISELTYFASVTYPVTPLLNLSFASMFYPDVDGYLLFPTIDYSLSDDMKLSLIAMYMQGDFEASGTTYTSENFMGFLRLKYGF